MAPPNTHYSVPGDRHGSPVSYATVWALIGVAVIAAIAYGYYTNRATDLGNALPDVMVTDEGFLGPVTGPGTPDITTTSNDAVPVSSAH